jgi:DnaJ-like protein
MLGHDDRLMKLESKYFDSVRVKPDKDRRQRDRHPVCAWPGCSAVGPHRAPRGRQFEGQYLNLCLEHVREYNKDYNFFQGLDDAAVSSFQKDAVTGHRPTWRLGENSWAAGRTGKSGFRHNHKDPFGLFGDASGAARSTRPARTVRNAELKALHCLGLEEGATSDQVKTRYKALVKRLHPDANGGSRDNEDKLKEVIQAYDYLCSSGFC